MRLTHLFSMMLAVTLAAGLILGAATQAAAEPPDPGDKVEDTAMKGRWGDCPCPYCEGHGPAWQKRGRRGGQIGQGRHGQHGRHGGMDGMRMGRRGGLAADRILRHATALELTDAQVEKLEALAYEARKQTIDLRAKMETERLELRHELESGKDDLAALKRRLAAMEKTRTSLHELRLTNWIESKKVLSDAQKQTIKEKFPRLGSMLD